MKALLDTFPDLFFRLHRDGTFLDFRSPAGTVLYAPRDQIIGNRLTNLLPPAVAAQAVEAIGHTLVDGKMHTFEYHLPAPPAGRGWDFEARVIKIADDEVLVIVRDITERKRLEAQRLELTIEREKVRALSDFIEVASHDFKTPLSILSTSAYLLRKIQDPQKRLERIRAIDEQVARLNKLIDQLLTMSALNNPLELRFAGVSPVMLLHDVEMLARQHFSGRALDITFDVEADLPSVNGDPSKLFKVLVNLLENAVRFTEDGGRITARARSEGQWVVIEMEDTGVGIAPEDLPHIFGSFYKGDKSRSDDRGGSGLGLAIARRIVELHGGTIEVRSKAGVGSVFRVNLPVQQVVVSR
jgi:signal transduction histidine kinase